MNDAVLHAEKQDVFCRDCVFYAPLRREQRCGHPRAVQKVKTYEGPKSQFIEPEDKNAHNDCADFKAGPLRRWTIESVLVVGLLGLLGLASVLGLLFGFQPWVVGMVYASIAGAIVLVLLRT
jgi:hypothetical protein